MLVKYLAFICLYLDFNDALHWTSSGFSNNSDTVISLKMSTSEPKIDVHQKDQIIILKDMPNYYTPIAIYCFIAGFGDDSDIVFSFCKDQDCAGPYKDGGIEQSVTVLGMKLTIETKFPNRKGMKLELMFPMDSIDSSGNFHCKAFDNVGHFMIRSSNIQIRDRVYWEQNLVLNTDNIKSMFVGPINLPLTFTCMEAGLRLNPAMPEWIRQEFVSPVSWTICPVKQNYKSLAAGDRATFSKCIHYTTAKWSNVDESLRPLDLSEMKKWRFAVNWRGELTVFPMEVESRPAELSYGLMCYSKRLGNIVPIVTYVRQYRADDIMKGLEFNSNIPSTMELQAISPPVDYVNLHTRVIPQSLVVNRIDRVAIYAKYYAPATAKATWFHNGDRLYNGVDRICDNYKVEFIRDITSDMGGNYTLVVTDNNKSIVMTNVATVLGPPVLMNPDCLPIVAYVWENNTASFSCRYRDRPVELKIQINNQEIKLDNQINLINTNLHQNYPYLAELQFNITPTSYVASDNVTLTYNVFHLRKSQGQTKYQDHTVTFFVKNNYGLSVKGTSIYTVPKVAAQVQKFPDTFNCTTSCVSTESHSFQCRFNAKEYKNKELKIDHYWTINGHRLDQFTKTDNSFAPYFSIDPITKDLVLFPIISNNSNRDSFVKEALTSNFIVCHIDLQSVTDSATDFLYRSANDPLVNYKLRSKITIDYHPSNVSFISGIIVALIVVIIIAIIIFIVYNRMRSFGETYQLEKLEQKHGLNRDQEVAEEVFQPYQPDSDHHMDNISVNSETSDNEFQPEHGINTALIDEHK